MSSEEDLSEEESGGIPSESDSDDEGGIEDSDSDDDKDIGSAAPDTIDESDVIEDSDDEEEQQTKGWFKQIEDDDDDDEEEEGEEEEVEESPLDQSRRLVDEILTELENKFEKEGGFNDWEIVLKLFPEMTKLVEKCKKLSGHPPSNYIIRLARYQHFIENKKKEDKRYFHELSKRSKKALSQFRNILNKEMKSYSRAMRDFRRNPNEFRKKDLGSVKKVEEEVKKKWWLKTAVDSDDEDSDDDDEGENDAWLEEDDSDEESGEEGDKVEGGGGIGTDGKPQKGTPGKKIEAYLHEKIAWTEELVEKRLDEYGLNVTSKDHEHDLLDMYEATKQDELKVRIQMLLLNISINQHNVNWYECCFRMLDIIDMIEHHSSTWEFFIGAKVPDKQQQQEEEEEEIEGENEDKIVIPIICEFFVFVRTVFRGYISLLQNTDRNTIEFVIKLSHERIILNLLERFFRYYETKARTRYCAEIGLHIMYILHGRIECDHDKLIRRRNVKIVEKLRLIKEKEEALRKKKEEEEQEALRKKEEKEEEEQQQQQQEEDQDDDDVDDIPEQPPLEEDPKQQQQEVKTTDSDLLEEKQEEEVKTTEEEEVKKKKEEGEEEEEGGKEEEKEKEKQEEEDPINPYLPKIVLKIPRPPLVVPSLYETFSNIRNYILKTRGTDEHVMSSLCYLICTCAVNNNYAEAKFHYLSNQRKLAHYFLSHHERRSDRGKESRNDDRQSGKVKKEASIQLKVLFNRTMTQLGMCAFRSSEFVDCCSILGDIHGNTQKKQLLSQAIVINPKTQRVEKSKLWPYHMLINLDVLEAYYLISLIFMEIPIKKFVPFLHSKSNAWQDQNRGIFLNKRKRVRSFRNYATYYSRQIYSAPPKTTRELIFYSVKRMIEHNDWKTAFECLCRLECWKFTRDMTVSDKDEAEEMNRRIQKDLQKELKKVCVRNYLHRSGDSFDKLSVEFMVKKFELTKKEILQVVSEVIIKDGWNARIGGGNKEWIMLKKKNRKFSWSIYHSLNERTRSVNSDIFNVQ